MDSSSPGGLPADAFYLKILFFSDAQALSKRPFLSTAKFLALKGHLWGVPSHPQAFGDVEESAGLGRPSPVVSDDLVVWTSSWDFQPEAAPN